jgi:hypothetical protein
MSEELQIISLILSVISIIVAVLTIYMAFFRKGSLKIIKPHVIYIIKRKFKDMEAIEIILPLSCVSSGVLTRIVDIQGIILDGSTICTSQGGGKLCIDVANPVRFDPLYFEYTSLYNSYHSIIESLRKGDIPTNAVSIAVPPRSHFQMYVGFIKKKVNNLNSAVYRIKAYGYDEYKYFGDSWLNVKFDVGSSIIRQLKHSNKLIVVSIRNMDRIISQCIALASSDYSNIYQKDRSYQELGSETHIFNRVRYF